HDRAGVQQFFAEAGQLVQQLTGALRGDLEHDLRVAHTLKGNCRQLGLESMADLCHQAESEMQDERRPLDAAFRARLAARWQQIADLASFAGDDPRRLIEVGEDDLAGLIAALRARAPHQELIRLAESWRLEPVAARLERLAEKARYISERMGKPQVTVHFDAGGLRMDSERWAPFWNALVHAINNAIDHGIEESQARTERGKPAAGPPWPAAP